MCESDKELADVLEIISTTVRNAVIIPDPKTRGATDAVMIPMDDYYSMKQLMENHCMGIRYADPDDRYEHENPWGMLGVAWKYICDYIPGYPDPKIEERIKRVLGHIK